MRLRIAAIVSIALMLLVARAPGALAQEPPGVGLPFVLSETNLLRYDEILATEGWDVSFDLEDRLLEALFIEIAVLYELDAFGGIAPRELGQIHAAYAPFPEVDRSELLDLLPFADDELAAAGEDLDAIIDVFPRPPMPALDLLTTQALSDLGAGLSGVIGGEAYIMTLGTILSRGTSHLLADEGILGMEMFDLPIALDFIAYPGAIDEMLAAIGATREDSSVDPDPGPSAEIVGAPEIVTSPDIVTSSADQIIETVGASETGPDASSRLPMMAGGVLTVLAIIGFALFAWRRRHRDHRTSPDLSELHRRLIGALDEAQIAEIVMPHAIRLTAADNGALLRPIGTDSLRMAGLTEPVEGSRFRHAVDTGQPVIGLLVDDPLLPGETVHVAAVPMIAAGAMSGVIAVWRQSDRPFDQSARDALETLAPYTAAALASADRHGSMTHMALVDGLTSLGNRRRLDHDLSATLQKAVAAGLPVAFAMVDVDHFKNYNDSHGHGAGDEALRQVASVIAAHVRDSDIVYRYGGEEFSILLPGSNAEEAQSVAERVRAAVQDASFPGEEMQPGGTLTVSVGVATLASSTPDALKARADTALYDAKSNGRNQVVMG